MKALLLAKASMIAALIAVLFFATNVGTAQGSDDCPGCFGSASPSAVEPVIMNANETCGIRFNFGAMSGRCEQQEPGTQSPCVPAAQCNFDVTALCLGDCSQWAQGLWSLDGAVIPIFVPCGTTLPLGTTNCGTTATATMVAYNVVTMAISFANSRLICSKCIN